jgi:Trypsin
LSGKTQKRLNTYYYFFNGFFGIIILLSLLVVCFRVRVSFRLRPFSHKITRKSILDDDYCLTINMAPLKCHSVSMALLESFLLLIFLFGVVSGNIEGTGHGRRKKSTNYHETVPGAGSRWGRGLSSPEARIFGGWETVEDRYAYAQVSMQLHAEGHQCGGSLVAPDMVLTAAHCSGSFEKVVIGKHSIYDPSDASETFGIAQEIIHPNYDSETTRFDNMLVLLDGRATLAQPVRVNSDPLVPVQGQSLMVVGWGYDENWDTPDVLMETQVTYTRNPECVNIQDENGATLKGDLYGDMLCAGAEGRDSCYGE